MCLHSLAVRTPPSHGGIWGSIPHGGTKESPIRHLKGCSELGFFIEPEMDQGIHNGSIKKPTKFVGFFYFFQSTNRILSPVFEDS